MISLLLRELSDLSALLFEIKATKVHIKQTKKVDDNVMNGRKTVIHDTVQLLTSMR